MDGTGPDAAPRTRRRSRRDRTGAASSMPLVEHLYELRRRLGIALAAIIVTTVFGYVWFEVALFGLPSLGALLKEPYCSLPASARATFTADGSCTLLGTGPFDQFMLRLKVGATAGVVLAAPVWLWQVWRFVVPALRRGERRYAVAFVTVSTLLFVAGAYLAHTIAPQGLGFLLTIGDEVQTTALTGQSYFAFVLGLLVVFGISFELPLLVVALNLAGVLPHATLARCRRGIVFGLFAFAAIATPGQDPISMLVLATALVLLFELAVMVARVHDARARRRTAQTSDDLDTPSDIDTTPSPLS